MSLVAAVDAAKGPPPFLDIRFDASGAPLRCSGNTVVAHVTEGAGRARLVALQAALRAGAAGECFAWLPPASLHMTLFDGLLHDRRGPGYWPAGLPEDADAGDADAFMLARLATVPAPGAGLNARIDGAHGLDGGGLGLSVSPSGEPSVRVYRDLVAAAAGLSGRPGHAQYPFHITLAYQIAWPDRGAAAEFDAGLGAGLAALMAAGPIELAAGEICLFEDMTHFAPQV